MRGWHAILTMMATREIKMLTDLHLISIDRLKVDEMFIICLAFGHLFGFYELNADRLSLICQHLATFWHQHQHFLSYQLAHI